MFFNYLKIAWRNLLKNPSVTIINTIGLAAGITIALLICLWIWDELSYNHYHSNHNRIARVLSIESINGATTAEPFASVPLAAALRNSYPGRFKAMALITETNQVIKRGDKRIALQGLFTEPAFPSIFTLHMLQGNQQALTDPSAILLSQSAATALFDRNNPLHQTLTIGNTAVTCAGVYEDIPANSSFAQTPFLLSWYNKDNPGLQLAGDWINHHFQLYVLMGDHISFEETSAAIKNITKPYIKGGWEEIQLLDLEGIRMLVALAWVAAGFLYQLGVTLQWESVYLLARLGGWEPRPNRPPGRRSSAQATAGRHPAPH